MEVAFTHIADVHRENEGIDHNDHPKNHKGYKRWQKYFQRRRGLGFAIRDLSTRYKTTIFGSQ